MSFPTTPLTVLIEVAPGADLTAASATWTFVDATTKVYTRNSLQIVRGRKDESSTSDSSTLAMTADNRDGRWSTRNPAGTWYGRLRKGTPVRVSAEGHVRYTGFFDSLPPRWDVSGRDRYAPVTAKGLLYRLTQGSLPAWSAMRRSMSAASPVAQWPLEDGPAATVAGSALTGGVPLRINGPRALMGVTMAAAGVLSGCSLLAGDTLSGATGIAAGVSTSWEVEMVVGFDPLPTGNLVGNRYTVARIQTPGGTVTEVGVSVATGVFTAGQYNLGVNYVDGTGQHNLFASTPVVVGQMYDLRAVYAQVSAGVIRRTVYVDGVLSFTDTTELTGTLYAPTSLTVNDPMPGDADPSANPLITNVAFYSPARTTATTYQAVNGYQGEQAHTRFLRLCTEEGVLGTSSATESQAMGAQTARTFLELIRECEASDQGYLYEGLDFGLTLQGHVERENLSAALALNYTTAGHVAPPLEPTDDDQGAINDAEVKRAGGSSSRLTELDPNVELSIPNIGRRTDSQTYSLYTDGLTGHLAGWRRYVGTFAGYRFPTLALNLAAAPSLITAVTAAGLAFRTTIDNPPTDVGPDQVSVLVEGYTETLGQYDWDIAANCSLAGPWRVGILANDVGDTNPLLGRDDWDSCVLAAAMTTTQTTATVTPVPLITTAADDWPFDVLVDGEQMTVTAVASYLNANPYFETSASPWTGLGGTAVRSTAQFHEGAASLLLTPDGVSATAEARGENVAATPSTAYQTQAWVRCASSRNVRINIIWRNAALGIISTSTAIIGVTAATWTLLTISATSPLLTATGQPTVSMATTPPVTDLLYIDEAMLIDPLRQVLTVTRSVNTAVKTHSSGAAVTLAAPLILTL